MTKPPINKWSSSDRQAFQDGNRLKSVTIPDKRKLRNKHACRVNIPIDHNFD